MKITSSFSVTLGCRKSGSLRLSSLGFFLTLTGLRFCARRRPCTFSTESASITPFLVSPVRARASQTHSAMTPPCLVRALARRASSCFRCGAAGRVQTYETRCYQSRKRSRNSQQPAATTPPGMVRGAALLQHAVQFVGIRGAPHRVLATDLSPHVGVAERLVHGLHAAHA